MKFHNFIPEQYFIKAYLRIGFLIPINLNTRENKFTTALSGAPSDGDQALGNFKMLVSKIPKRFMLHL